MNLKVTVVYGPDDTEITVNSLEQLYSEIAQFDPSIAVRIEFHEISTDPTGLKVESFISATVDE